MYLIKVGEDSIKLVDRNDVKVLMSKLLDIGCTERMTAKQVIDDEDLEGEKKDD